MRLPLLVFHISAGVLAMFAGAAAVSFRKGSRWHGMAGNVFFISMLTMSGCGAYMALMKSEVSNVFGGLLTFYMVATAWVTARRRDGGTGIYGWVGLLAALGLGAVMVSFGIGAAMNPTSTEADAPAGMYFVFGSLALLAAAGDARMLVHGGVFGVQRIARHLWRMCFALFVASGSLFLARPHLFPALLSKTHVLLVLGFLPLILMIFWLVRVRFKNAFKITASPYPAHQGRSELRGQALAG